MKVFTCHTRLLHVTTAPAVGHSTQCKHCRLDTLHALHICLQAVAESLRELCSDALVRKVHLRSTSSHVCMQRAAGWGRNRLIALAGCLVPDLREDELRWVHCAQLRLVLHKMRNLCTLC